MAMNMTEEEYRETFGENKSMLEILLEIGEHHCRFKDLKGILRLDSNQLTKLLEKGIQHGIWERRVEEEEINDYSAEIYELTERGRSLFREAENVGLHDGYTDLRSVETQYRGTKARWAMKTIESKY